MEIEERLDLCEKRIENLEYDTYLRDILRMRDKHIEELEQKLVRVYDGINLLPEGVRESFLKHLEPPEEEFLDF